MIYKSGSNTNACCWKVNTKDRKNLIFTDTKMGNVNLNILSINNL